MELSDNQKAKELLKRAWLTEKELSDRTREEARIKARASNICTQLLVDCVDCVECGLDRD